MLSSEATQGLIRESDSRIILFVIDGLGGLPDPATGLSELETACLPNLDAIAAGGSCGTIAPVGSGITPGSGPAHLALFGYDARTSDIGRGALAAFGLGMDFRAGDVAARLNFCTLDGDGLVADRRAGRIPTERCAELCRLLAEIEIPGVEVAVQPELEYRATAIFRGDGLSAEVDGSDPQQTGRPPLSVTARQETAQTTAAAARAFLDQARRRLEGEAPANMVLMRGFGAYPDLPRFADRYGLKALGVAGYPMYRGLAAAVGMEIAESGPDIADELEVVRSRYRDYDFIYLHFKPTDSAGEDGDFGKKVRLLEQADRVVAELRALEPEVLVVTGDHSTPSIMRSHSWHPVPLAIESRWSLPEPSAVFSEVGCRRGTLGELPSSAVMALALAHAGRLDKFGA